MSIVQLAPYEIADIIINFVCIQNVKNHLTKLGIDPILFLTILKKHECAISGSFILACYLNEQPYYGTNIDIYGLYNDKHKIGDSIYHPFENEIYDNLISADKSEMYMHQYDNLAYIVYSICCDIGSKYHKDIIQFVSVRINPLEFIKRVFDFNEIKIGFDGDNIHSECSSIVVLEKKININNIRFAHVLQQEDIYLKVNLTEKTIFELLTKRYLYIIILTDNITISIPSEENVSFNLISYNNEELLVKVKNGIEQFNWNALSTEFANNIRTPITRDSPKLYKNINEEISNICYHRNSFHMGSKIINEFHNHIGLIIKTLGRIEKYAKRGWKFVSQ